MSDVVIRVENLSKQYRLGAISGRTLREDLTRLGAKWRGQPDPTLKIDQPDPNRHSNEQHWALQDVSFEVKQGEVLGIIGRNGAGKSTLLKILSRVTAPTSGAAKVKGRIASLLEVGTGFHPELTGRENVYLNGSILGMRKHEIDQRFDEIVGFSGVERFINTPVKRYSSGMYVRLAFAVAAYLEPEILLVDEVLAVGDLEFQKKCLGKMANVASEGRTILFISHNIKALEAICQRGIVLEQGKLRYNGTINDAVRCYRETTHQKTEIVKVADNGILWNGVVNKDELDNLAVADDLNVRLEFENIRPFTQDIYIDFAILNDKNEVAIHSKSSFVSSCFTIPKHTIFQINYNIESPRLAPGQYHMTVYIYSNKKVLLWIEEVDLCYITSVSDFGRVTYYDGLTSTTIPKFSLDLSIK
jgi:lipopolysaccharide transport system ATP-binding protein